MFIVICGKIKYIILRVEKVVHDDDVEVELVRMLKVIKKALLGIRDGKKTFCLKQYEQTKLLIF